MTASCGSSTATALTSSLLWEVLKAFSNTLLKGTYCQGLLWKKASGFGGFMLYRVCFRSPAVGSPSGGVQRSIARTSSHGRSDRSYSLTERDLDERGPNMVKFDGARARIPSGKRLGLVGRSTKLPPDVIRHLVGYKAPRQQLREQTSKRCVGKFRKG